MRRNLRIYLNKSMKLKYCWNKFKRKNMKWKNNLKRLMRYLNLSNNNTLKSLMSTKKNKLQAWLKWWSSGEKQKKNIKKWCLKLKRKWAITKESMKYSLQKINKWDKKLRNCKWLLRIYKKKTINWLYPLKCS